MMLSFQRERGSVCGVFVVGSLLRFLLALEVFVLRLLVRDSQQLRRFAAWNLDSLPGYLSLARASVPYRDTEHSAIAPGEILFITFMVIYLELLSVSVYLELGEREAKSGFRHEERFNSTH